MALSLESGDYFSYICQTIDKELITGTERLVLGHIGADIGKLSELKMPKIIKVVQKLISRSTELSKQLESTRNSMTEVNRFLKGSKYYKHVSDKLFKLMCRVEKEKNRKFKGMYVTDSMISTLLIDLNSKQTDLDKVKSVHTWLCGFENRSPNIFCEIYSYLGTVMKTHRKQLTQVLCNKVNARSQQLTEMIELMQSSNQCVPDYNFVSTLREDLQSGINKLRNQVDAMIAGESKEEVEIVLKKIQDHVDNAEDYFDTRLGETKTYEHESKLRTSKHRELEEKRIFDYACSVERSLTAVRMDYKNREPLRKNEISMAEYLRKCNMCEFEYNSKHCRWFGFNINDTLYKLFYLQDLDYKLIGKNCDTCSKEEFEDCMHAIDKICELTHSKQSFVAKLIYTRRFYNVERRDDIYAWERLVYKKTLTNSMQRLKSSRPNIKRVLDDITYDKLFTTPKPDPPVDLKARYTGPIRCTIGVQCDIGYKDKVDKHKYDKLVIEHENLSYRRNAFAAQDFFNVREHRMPYENNDLDYADGSDRVFI